MSRRERIADELLVLRCQEGDVAAFDDLVSRWQERLWRFAWRLTGNEQAAWDVIQDSWMAIVPQLPKLQDAAAFPAWAYRITSNKARDWVRRTQRQRKADEVYSDQAAGSRTNTQTADDQRSTLKEALKQLPSRDRAILSLRYEEGFDTGEIAEIMNIPIGTVKSRLHYARNRLREYLGDLRDE